MFTYIVTIKAFYLVVVVVAVIVIPLTRHVKKAGFRCRISLR